MKSVVFLFTPYTNKIPSFHQWQIGGRARGKGENRFIGKRGNSLTSPLPLTAPAGRRQDREPKESIVTNELRFTPALTLLEDFGPNGQCGVTLSDYCSGSDDVATVQTFVSKQAAESFIDAVRREPRAEAPVLKVLGMVLADGATWDA